jgi:hypothetical protein
MSEGFVKLIRGSWNADPQFDRLRAQDPYLGSNAEGTYEEVEGCRAYDVGWAKVRLNEYLSWYCNLQSEDVWDRQYVRPPGLTKAGAA